ncbi:hypothetical protein [Psychromonas sp. KJ10-2]|uniref:hypothetical protein n=1 Tax=Psychromonas sp. KJ10-2 TaxID=3391822 RepID=UPI0039B54791
MTLENSTVKPTTNWVVRLAFLINIISLGGFMMVVPLGPDLVKSIDFNPAHIELLDWWGDVWVCRVDLVIS